MDYKKIYDKLVETRVKLRGRNKKRGDGLNRHHILPKCLGGEDNLDNYVLFTFKEHIVAHHLLTKIYPDNNKLKYAYLRMIQSSKSDRKENTYKVSSCGEKIAYKLNLTELEELRKISVDVLRESNLGRKLSEDVKEKLRKAHLGKKASKETKELLSQIRTGHDVSDSTRKKISEARLGMRFSEETKRRISESRKGVKLSEEAKKKISGENSVSSKKVVDSKGNVFTSIRECAKQYSVNEGTISQWIKKNKNGFKFYNDGNLERKIIGPDGTIYDSFRDCARKLGRAKSTISRWVKSNKNGFRFV